MIRIQRNINLKVIKSHVGTVGKLVTEDMLTLGMDLLMIL